MSFLDTYLTSGHTFSKENYLAQFRFNFLNGLTHLIVFFITLHYFTSFFGFIILAPLFEIAVVVYMLISYLSLWLLKKDKKYYTLVSNTTIIAATILFYLALILMLEDEFRMVWFLVVVFVAFIVKGRRYGMILMLFILFAVLITYLYYDLHLSTLAIYTFFNSFFVFSAFSFFFLRKIEKDEEEFKRLRIKLSNKISLEVHQRQKQEKILLSQSRLAHMGEMIDSIAHQWRQPLMNINAILMNMDRAIETQSNPKEYLANKMDEVIILTTHMSQTIEDFRSLLRADKEKVHFHIDKSIAQSLELFEETLKDINVQITGTKGLTFFGYNNELIQVIMILLNNAIDILQVRKIKSKKIMLHVSLDSTGLFLSIEDNAGGIDTRYFENIFDPYFTTKKTTGGTGLGLYIAKIIIEQNMHGSLDAENTNNGAKFIIRLPNT